MEGLLSLLMFAGLFYFMMRFGCGAHMVHGHSGHGGHGEHLGRDAHQEGSRAIDPVCGMEVPPGEGYTKIHASREYRFCSRVCLDKFDENPDRYTSAQGGLR